MQRHCIALQGFRSSKWKRTVAKFVFVLDNQYRRKKERHEQREEHLARAEECINQL